MKKPIKSLFVFPASQIYGGEQVWLKFLERVDRRRILPFALLFGKGKLSKRLDEINIPYYLLPETRIRKMLTFLKNLFHMMSFLKEEKFDIVNSLGVHLLTTLSTSILSVPYVLHIHTIHPLSLVDRWCVRKAKHIVTVSNFSKNFLIGYEVKSEYIEVVYNGIDIEELERRSKGVNLREELGLGEDTYIVCYIGRIVKWKNLDVLIKVIPNIKQEFQGKVKFLFVGDIPRIDTENFDYKDTLLKLAEDLGVQGEVIFTGRREDIPDILKNIDIFVLPSHLETFPMCILEAMAFSKPVVAVEVGGIPELITEDTGILVRPNDLDGLTRAITELLKDEGKRKEMGEAGYRRVREFFDIENNVTKLESIIECLLQK
ncbi:MAG: glycosyltransferase family 4 protein [Candidatus Omnitrophica bacterium]|nr:glycosyltransferase family 4 protein [Candidatus Omnitrophota bacterium]